MDQEQKLEADSPTITKFRIWNSNILIFCLQLSFLF